MPAIRRVLAAAALAAALFPASVLAQDFDNEVRLRISGYFPTNLPTKVGTLWGLEFRNFLTARDAFTYGIYYFSEQRTEFRDFNVVDPNGGFRRQRFALHADIKMQPLLAGWIRTWDHPSSSLFAGLGGGFYPVKAISAGGIRPSVPLITNVGDFRSLRNETLFGGYLTGGADFFLEGRFGLSLEGRFHFVQNSYNAAEVAVSGLFRF